MLLLFLWGLGMGMDTAQFHVAFRYGNRSKDYAQWRMTVLPYSWDPRFVYLEDDRLGIEYEVGYDGMVVTGTKDFYGFPLGLEFHHPN